MTPEALMAEAQKRERAWNPRQRWRAVLAAIAFAEKNSPPGRRRNPPRWHPGSVLTRDGEKERGAAKP